MKRITVSILIALSAGSAFAQNTAQVPAITATLAQATPFAAALPQQPAGAPPAAPAYTQPAGVPQLPVTPGNSPVRPDASGAGVVPPAPYTPGGPPLAPATPVVLQPTPAPKKTNYAVDRAKARFDVEQRAQIAEYIGTAEQKPTVAHHAGSATVYSFRDGGIYVVYAGIERITDIALQPGEEVVGTGGPVAGDTARWIIATITSGAGATKQTHIIVKPTDSGIVTNLMIPTNKHVYMVDLRSVDDWYMPSVRWTYPAEELAKLTAENQAAAAKQAVEVPTAAVSPEQLDFNYRIKGRYDWAPLQVFSDGVKTYLRMPANLNATDAPVLFINEDGKLMQVNFRVKGLANGTTGPTYEVDRLFDRGELRVGAKHVVTIIRHPRWYQ
ncbi:P-type conjugative transfer protein TrbG [Xanthomonas theicola]|uniref:P-type conjugative transfer protein TrbG n=1 Tax=Xanthomonas theicola TaxID=56464 RepID=A0A2S6ZGN8_9XANT|nr:P-type conjugative transfer protein TrbG [Xanthomonas theicola]PPT91422.1 P-type conjugative transfer protein TrbG [Xanthomonas theicola]QNH27226.1 P-type conjugative transfer protein TrbG [Xanthomonas theicola]